MYGADGRTGADEAVGQMGGRGGKGADGGGKGADSRADGRTGPTKRRHANGQKSRGRGPARTDGQIGGQANG